MNKSYIEWIDYYENATKEDVIQDMMLEINSIKEKDKEIERLNNIIKDNKYTADELYEIDRLNNIIDELEKDIKYTSSGIITGDGIVDVNITGNLLKRLKELKEGK